MKFLGSQKIHNIMYTERLLNDFVCIIQSNSLQIAMEESYLKIYPIYLL